MIKHFNPSLWGSKRTDRLLLFFVVLLFPFCAQAEKNTFRSLANDEFAILMSHHDVQLVDVRTPQEFDLAHLSGAININLQDDEFENEIRKLDKKRPVALYCRSGARSKTAARMLSEWGYTVSELNDGIMNWNGKTE